MALEELPHHDSRIDFFPGPRVPKAVDANHANLAAVRASFITHGGQRTRRVVEDCVSLARVVTRPPCERVGNTLEPFLTAVRLVPLVCVLGIGQTVKSEDRNRATTAARAPIGRRPTGCITTKAAAASRT